MPGTGRASPMLFERNSNEQAGIEESAPGAMQNRPKQRQPSGLPAGVRALALMLVACTTLGPNGSHEMYNVLQPSMVKPPRISNCSRSDCCPDCLGMGDDSYNVMFTLMFWGSALALTVTGQLLDKFGNCVIVPILLLCSVGTLLVAVGGCYSSSPVFLPTTFIGSALWGLGYLPSIVARDRVIAGWFKGSDIGVAFGVASCVNRVASLVVFTGTEPLRMLATLQVALWVAAAVCFLSLACAVAIAFLDAWRQRNAEGADENDGQPPRLRDLLGLGGEFWLLLGIVGLVFTVHNTLQDNLTEFVHDTRGRSKFESALIGGSVHYVGILAAPVAGVVMDRLGRPALLICVASFVLAPAVGLLAFAGLPPLPFIVTSGVCTASLYVLIIGSMTMVISKQATGTALSLTFCVGTLLAGVAHAIVAKILGRGHSIPAAEKAARWRSVLALTFGVCCLSLLASFLLLGLAAKRGSCLMSSERASSQPDSPQYSRLKQLDGSDGDDI